MTRPSLFVCTLAAYCVYEHGYEGGTATHVRITLGPQSFTVEDDGRGMGLHRDGYVDGLIEQLAARRGRVAIHGLGLALVAMGSPLLEVDSRRGGQRYRQDFSWGVAQGPVRVAPWDGPSGSRITCTLAEGSPPVDAGEVAAQVALWRAAHPALRIDVETAPPGDTAAEGPTP